MSGELHLGGPVRDNDQQRHGVQACAQEGQQVDGRRIRPVEVLEEEDEGPTLGRGLKESLDLTLHPLG